MYHASGLSRNTARMICLGCTTRSTIPARQSNPHTRRTPAAGASHRFPGRVTPRSSVAARDAIRRVARVFVRMDRAQPGPTRRRSWPRSARTPGSMSRTLRTQRWYKQFFFRNEVAFVITAHRESACPTATEPLNGQDCTARRRGDRCRPLFGSGAKSFATTSSLTLYFIANNGALPIQTRPFAFFCIVSYGARREAVSVVPRRDYVGGHGHRQPCDYPLSSRMDETTRSSCSTKCCALEDTCSPMATRPRSTTFSASWFLPRFMFQGCTRACGKMDFLSGCCSGREATRQGLFRGVQAQFREVLSWLNLFWWLTDAMAARPEP